MLTARISGRMVRPRQRPRYPAQQTRQLPGASSDMITDVGDDLRLAVTFGADQPQRFLTAWLGPPSRDAPEPASLDLPAALAQWHKQAARWEHPVIRQNRVPARREMDGDMLLVGVEN
jgi:hypothetical protein